MTEASSQAVAIMAAIDLDDRSFVNTYGRPDEATEAITQLSNIIKASRS